MVYSLTTVVLQHNHSIPTFQFFIPHGLCVMIVAWPSCSCKEHNPGNVTLMAAGAVGVVFVVGKVATFGEFCQVKPLLIDVNCVQHLVESAGIWINMILTPANLFKLVFLCHGWLYRRGMFLIAISDNNVFNDIIFYLHQPTHHFSQVKQRGWKNHVLFLPTIINYSIILSEYSFGFHKSYLV